MEQMDGWAATFGDTACRFLSRNGHDTFYGAMCYDGSSAAGWKFLALIVVVGGLIVGLYRLFRPA